VLAEQLALSLVLLELGLEVGEVDDASDLGPQLLRELVGDGVLVPALGVGGDEADAQLFGGVEGVREGDLSWLEAWVC